MDLVNYDENEYQTICEEYNTFASAIKLNQPEVNISFIPMSALNGDMIVERGRFPKIGIKVHTLLEILENIDTTKETKNSQLRFPIQLVCRPRDSTNEELHDFRAFMGKIESGSLKVNDKIKVLPSNHESSIKEIRIGKELITEATYEQSVTVSLNDEIDISRGRHDRSKR